MTTETLHCALGNHSWERERKRGVKPANCPKHQPVKEASEIDLEERARLRKEEARKRAEANEAAAIAEAESLLEFLPEEDQRKILYINVNLRSGLRDQADERILRERRYEILRPARRIAAVRSTVDAQENSDQTD